MRRCVLNSMRFRRPTAGWMWSPGDPDRAEITSHGCIVDAPPGIEVLIDGPGVHTRNGDTIELDFDLLAGKRGSLRLSFNGGMARVGATLRFRDGRVTIYSSEWNRRQPLVTGKVSPVARGKHILKIEKAQGLGSLVRMVGIRVALAGQTILAARDVNVPRKWESESALTGLACFLSLRQRRGRKRDCQPGQA